MMSFSPDSTPALRIRSIYRSMFAGFHVSAEESGPAKDRSSTDLPARVLIGGGSGFVGTELTKELRRKGYEVIVVSRTAGEFRMTWDELYKKGIPERTAAIVNLTGQNVLDPLRRWNEDFKKTVYDSRVQTTQNLTDLVSSSPSKPSTFVQITGVGFYDFNRPEPQDESSTGGTHDFLARLVVDWEKPVHDMPKPVRTVIIRPGVVLGRNGGMIQQLFLPFFFGVGGPMGSGDQSMPWIHVKDLSGLIVHSIEKEEVRGVLNGVAPNQTSNKEFAKAFGQSLWRPAFIPLPEFVFEFVFGVDRANMITKGASVLPKRTLETGYKFRFPTITEACNEFGYLMYKDQDEMR